MPAILYLYDGATLWRRTSALIALVSVVLFFSGIALADEPDAAPTVPGIAFVLLVFVVTAADVWIVLNVRQGTTDGLRLDGSGLWKVAGGREVFWAWSDISGFRLHGRFHPANLLLGRCISFRAEGAGNQTVGLSLLNRILFFGQTSVIGDSYFVLPQELVDRLGEYREAAAGATRRRTRSGPEYPPPPAPALFIDASTLNGRERLRLLFLAGVALLVAGIFVAALLLFADHAWPDALDLLLDSGLAFYMALPILMVPAVAVVAGLWITSAV